MAAPGNPLLDGLDFSLAQPLSANPHLRTQAINRFSHVIEHFEALERKPYIRNYNRPALIRLTFEYARSAESQDRLLLAFFHRLRLGMRDSDGDIVFDSGLRSLLYAFAEDLMNSFFIPLRAAGSQHTPQLTPLSHAAIQNAQTQEDQDQIKASKGPTRLSTLRSVCLIRDRYRCAITHMFDKGEAVQRFEEAGRMGLQDPQDDEGNILDPDDAYTYLEVAHILPHSLTEETNGQLDNRKRSVIEILNMFDIGIIDEIQGIAIDQPHNAMSLTPEMHRDFGNFKVVFQHVEGTDPHTYHIKTFLPVGKGPRGMFPLTRTLFTHPTCNTPSERLLKLHCAIGHILHLSAAGEYIDCIFREMEEIAVRADGSTPLDVMVRIALEMKG